jgi:gliding motility-associated-like protein
VELTGLIVGNTYYFFIDGCSATQCSYWLEILEGGGVPEVFGPNSILCDDNFPDCDDICVGATVTFTMEDIINAVDFEWTINGGVVIETSNPELTYQFTSPGTFTFCGRGKNDCDEGDWFCFEVIVTQLPPEDLGTLDVCENDLPDGVFPDGWEGPAITTPGNHTFTTQNSVGCAFEQQVVVNAIPLEEIVVDTIGCENEEMWIGGEQFAQNVTDYVFLVDGAGSNGCDLRYRVTVNFLYIEGFLEADCSGLQDKPVKITYTPNSYTGSDGISYQWYRNGEPLVDDDPTTPNVINIDQSGDYSVIITLTSDGVDCVYDNTEEIQVDLELFKPDTPEPFEWETTVCNNTTMTFGYPIENTDPTYEYIWTYPTDVYSAILSGDGQLLTLSWFGSIPGTKEICVYGIHPECGNSDTICEQITVVAAPTAAFTMLDTICMTSTNVITYTGTGTPNGDYSWNFSGGIETSGTNGVGRGPHTISWNTPGIKMVTLEVEENGCLSPFLEKPVVVIAPPGDPLVTCESTATTLTFSWDPVAGSTGIVVELLDGQAGTQDGNRYVITDMNPNDTVIIQLLVQTDGYCPPFLTDSIICNSQDCPLIDVESFPADTTICLDGTNPAFILDYEINPAGDGDIRWTGPGIVDADTGLFDPNAAGPGSHTILMRYEYLECVYTDRTYITIYEQPTSDFSIDQSEICIKDEVRIVYNGNMPTGNPSWNFDGGTIIEGSGLTPHRIRWNSSGEKNVQLIVENNDCVSELISIPVVVHDTLRNIVIDCYPEVDNITFSWGDIDPQAESYRVMINGAEVANSVITSWNVDGLEPEDIVEITIEIIDKGICGDKVFTLTCEAIECPDYTIDISPGMDEVCLDSNTPTIQFVADVTSSDGSTAGSKTWSGTGINPETGLFDPKVAGPGTHVLRLNYRDVCTASQEFTIHVIQRPVAELSISDTPICVTDNTTVTFNDMNPGTSVYTWNYNGGDRLDMTSNSFAMSWDTPGTYNISLSVDNMGCESGTAIETVVVEPKLIAPVIECVNTTTYSVGISWNDIDCASNYRVLANGIQVAQGPSLTYNVTSLDPQQSVSFNVEAISDCACGNVVSAITCQTNPCPLVELNIIGLPEQVCQSNAGSVTLSPEVVGPGGGTIEWSGPGVSSNGVVSLQGLGTGTFTYGMKYTLANCPYETNVSIMITPNPVFALAKTDPLCHNDANGTISVAQPAGLEFFLGTQSSSTGAFEGLASGNYTIRARDAFGCESTQSISLSNPALMQPEITGNLVINENQKNKFQLVNVSGFQLSDVIWSLENHGIVCQGMECITVDVGINDDDILCVEVYDINGCYAITCRDVTFFESVNIDIPNVFSPDGDGINDIFYVRSSRIVEGIKEMRVFDRWGELVFFQQNVPVNDRSYGWNGDHRGKKVNPGVYVYYIVFSVRDREDIKLVGDVTVIR